MAKRFKELTALPSKIIIGDNPPVLLSALSEEERAECRKRMTERYAAEVNRQFALHPEAVKAWIDFHPTYLAMEAEKEATRKAEKAENE